MTQFVSKRLFDLFMAMMLALPAAFVCTIAVFIIALESRGNPVFAQRRVGRGQRVFTLYKLRTMSVGTANVASHEIDRVQITRVGTLLRRTKLDELPQLINVISGNMSFVGPRPCLPTQHELIEARAALGVYDVLPGITGLAQTRGIDMSDPRKLAKLDAAYISSWSFNGDIRLLAATFLGSGSGDAVA